MNSTGNGVHRPAGSNFEFGFWLCQDIWLQEMRVYFNSHVSFTFSDYAMGRGFTYLSFFKLPIPCRNTDPTLLLGLAFLTVSIPLLGSNHRVPWSLLWMGALFRGLQVTMNEPFWPPCCSTWQSHILTCTFFPAPHSLPQLSLITNPRFPPSPQSLFPLIPSGSNFSIHEHS